ncbi:hypothetical protein FDI21_gp331 [Pseudomonas phage Noxifer]|uniref:Uncharacterized protein n=1 Tax=Pseudomonas phage Noxifer TaxID=2006684 RepID=A0A1Y0SVD5_9CAUD|nr:hypothetical protein FDI21_gp331 [Pseudomonas phage Noxifer]ARV77380.1 hypothetical protein NOXIFER_214 [Pseudomonas phage Noxifer]
MSFEQRLQQKTHEQQQQIIHGEQAIIFNDMMEDEPEHPLWGIVAPMQSELAQDTYRGQHGNILVELKQSATDGSIAVVWSNWVGAEQYPFLSVQATPRPVPRAHRIAEASDLDDVLAMIEDINSNNPSASAVLIRMAFEAFKPHLLTCIDADPETNHYKVQAYVPDRSYILDIQLQCDVIQAALK